MTSPITPQQFSVAPLSQTLSRYQRNRDLIAVGAYVAGNDPQLDDAIARYPRLEAFPAAGYRRERRLPGRGQPIAGQFRVEGHLCPSQLPWTC